MLYIYTYSRVLVSGKNEYYLLKIKYYLLKIKLLNLFINNKYYLLGNGCTWRPPC